MKVTISTIGEFDRRARRLAKKYKSLKNDLRTFQQELMKNPFQGSDLGGGVRKIRMAIGSKGKGRSGGARVLTLNVLVSDDADEVTLLTIYDKDEISNVSDEYIEWLVSKVMK
ncbi:MAG: type II toxin-antitoxin system RelE/ParE family toxin [Prevotella sp.]|nr:type II toxin-antitoxin system RelE/ParE family toxin [Prevotella sp.]MBR0275669.1 type II toxin-antitoxin system RelE/ParE family toxin [Prevotella sp.]